MSEAQPLTETPARIGKEPVQKPGKSKQDYETPAEFIAAVERRYGPIGFDLAASQTNAKAAIFFDEKIDALKQPWGYAGKLAVPVAWLNPPFANIRPWAEKLDNECRFLRRWTLMLVPASMGSLWWKDHVLGKCQADGVTRMKFVGAEDAYPKDLALLAYGYGVSGHGFWQWNAADANLPPVIPAL